MPLLPAEHHHSATGYAPFQLDQPLEFYRTAWLVRCGMCSEVPSTGIEPVTFRV